MQIDLRLQQRQSLSQTQLQSLHILTLDSVELNQFLREEHLENPLLDYTETVPNTAKYGTGDLFTQSSDKRSDIPCITEDTLQQFLLSQLDISRYSKSEWSLIKYLIDCLDDNGYFSFSLEEIHSHTGVSKPILERCLSDLRSLDPPGIFSAGLADCLIRQLNSDCESFEVMKAMILFHMEDMANGRISAISRDLHLSTAAVRKCIEHIRTLNPRPLAGFSPKRDSCIIPDLIFSYKDGNWEIQLNDDWVENYHLNDYYLRLLKTATDPELTAYFEEKLTRVQLIFSCIEQRRKTLISIAKCLLKHQEGFFLSTDRLRPMTMASLANELGLHPSTLSRAIKGKYIQYPKGTILCKNLFTAAVSQTSSEASLSQADIKEQIRRLIEAENPRKPLSDQKLAQLLASQDIQISRRAVAKYRQELGIGSSTDRKE